jgi:hypothetical protein
MSDILTKPTKVTDNNGLRLYDRADGVKGHFCIGRKVTGRGFDYNEFWNDGKFTSAGEVFIGEETAESKLRELETQLRDSEIANAEWAVVEAAVKWKKTFGCPGNEAAWTALSQATDNLIALRESVERENG